MPKLLQSPQVFSTTTAGASATGKVGVVIGTRPEAIKMAPVINELFRAARHTPALTPIVFLSGQHRQLLDEALALFGITPDYDLNVMTTNQQLAAISARMVTGFDQFFAEARPALVLVHGDTTTAYAAALAAFYRRIPVGHVEAGLRSGVPDSPFPEEFNRRAIDSVSSLFFAPTGEAVLQLTREGVPANSIVNTGNTVIDALLHVVATRRRESETKIQSLWKNYQRAKQGYRFVLVTSHRRENLAGEGLTNICRALLELIRRVHNIMVLFPVHPNPAVSGVVRSLLANQERVILLPPLDYEVFSFLMSVSTLILTDSGGVQEEAPALRKPVLILRDNSERPEVVRSGGAVLVGTSQTAIVATAVGLLTNQTDYERMANAGSPYGDGRAAQRIVQSLQQKLCSRTRSNRHD